MLKEQRKQELYEAFKKGAEDMLKIEKYSPSKLDQLVNEKDISQRLFNALLDSDEEYTFEEFQYITNSLPKIIYEVKIKYKEEIKERLIQEEKRQEQYQRFIERSRNERLLREKTQAKKEMKKEKKQERFLKAGAFLWGLGFFDNKKK